jgi:hypothetical protein
MTPDRLGSSAIRRPDVDARTAWRTPTGDVQRQAAEPALIVADGIASRERVIE